MRANVLPDVRRAKRAGRFVWLSIDTEQPQNAGFLEKFPVASWPTFFVVDPADESVVLKWLGSGNAEQLDRLLADAERARRDAAGAATALARADRAYGAGRTDEAVALYREAIARGGAAWDRRPRAIESLVLALGASGRDEACAEAARRDAPSLPRGPSFANAVGVGLSCAAGADSKAPWRAAALAELAPLGAEAVKLPGLLADDRSGLFEALADARAAQGDEGAAKETARAWWRFLEEERSSARTAEERAALDGQRVEAAMHAGDTGLALPGLERSQRELPRDYNPPARLALVYRELGKLAEARAAVERALALAYGPRKLKVYDLAASILEKQGDRDALGDLLSQALRYADELPRPQRDDRVVRKLQARLAAAER
jgi:tetratricopeptide (TPR) repeat protein